MCQHKQPIPYLCFMANNRGPKRKATDEDHDNAPALRRKLLDHPGFLGHCFPEEPRFGAFLPSQSTGKAEKSSTAPQRRKLKLPNKLGRPALLDQAKERPFANTSQAVQDVLEWEAPEFVEGSSTPCLGPASGSGAEKHVDMPAQQAGLPSSHPALPAAAVSSPVLAGEGGLGRIALLGNDLGTPSGTAPAHVPAPVFTAPDAGPNSTSSPAAAAPIVPGQKVISAAQQTDAPVLQPQHAPQQTILPGATFGQPIPEQVFVSRSTFLVVRSWLTQGCKDGTGCFTEINCVEQAAGFAAGAPQGQPRKMVRAKRFSRR